MKNLFPIILFSIFVALPTYSRKNEYDFLRYETDEFTGTKIIQTEYEQALANFVSSVNISFSKLNDNYFVDIKMILLNADFFTISKDDPLMLKLDNGEIIRLKALKNETTCKGCGAPGFVGSGAFGIHQVYPISKPDMLKLCNNNILKIRIYTSEGYIDGNLREKRQINIKGIANLLMNR